VGRTGIVRHKKYMEHSMGAYHPESPERLRAIYAMLDEPEMADLFVQVPVREATREELLAIHSSDYIERIKSTSGVEYTYLDPDTQTCAASYEAALLAAGGLCEAISMVLSGKLDNAFALVRPPGHHAERSEAKGFCLFNNVAVGARFSQSNFKVERILIVDWDLHHGNGTQHSFESDPSVLYFSTHQYPYYPGSGAFNEVGIGEGRGLTINVPLSTGYGDGEFVGIYEKILKPIALEFKPEIVLVSAGFDIYKGDPLGGMRVSTGGFAALTRVVMDIADTCCQGKVVLTLEGGYDVEGERDSVKEVLKELAGASQTNSEGFLSRADHGKLQYTIGQVKSYHREFWKNL